MTIMQEYAHKYDDSINGLLALNTLRAQLEKKISRLNKLRKENMENRNEYYVIREARIREIMAIEKELFHEKLHGYGNR